MESKHGEAMLALQQSSATFNTGSNTISAIVSQVGVGLKSVTIVHEELVSKGLNT